MYMGNMRYLVVAALLSVAWVKVKAGHSEKDAPDFLAKVNEELQKLASARAYKEWDYKVTLTEQAAKDWAEAKEKYNVYLASVWPEANEFPWKTFKDPLLRRQFFYLVQLDEAALKPRDRAEMSDVISKMSEIYSTAKLKKFNSTNTDATLNFNDVAAKFSSDFKDACEMSFYWQGWQNIGRQEKSHFEQYVELSNKVATLNNFTDNAARWQSKYEIDDIEDKLADLFAQFKSFYEQLHAYMRRKLWVAHGKDSNIIDLEGPIPANMLGDPWGMNAANVYSICVPYPNIPPIDVTAQLIAQKYNGKKMTKAAEDFLVSLGLPSLTEEFWKYSILERPAGVKNIDCSAEVFDFFNGSDYRIKYCASPSLNDFGGLHQEVGLIENFMAWEHLPFLLRRSPNEGFTGATGELINQYVTSPTHLKSLGLLDPDWRPNKEQEINYLMLLALYDMPFMPYVYSMDLWRWRVFQGKITPKEYNCKYWEIRSQFQGFVPPVDRDENDFDPGAKYHVDNDEQYMKYFMNVMLQYQMHRSLCIDDGQYDPKDPNTKPLYLCDITNSFKPGEKVEKMMSLGASKTWQDALEIVTGQRDMDATSLLEYFEPLHAWLVKENKKNDEKIGWTSGKIKFCEKKVSPAEGPCNYS